jgi:DNA-binding transcriptional regulator YiaG
MKRTIKINPRILEWARRKAYLTESGLARSVGVSIQKYREWEAGRAYPSRTELTRLALALKCPAMVFVCLGVLNR